MAEPKASANSKRPSFAAATWKLRWLSGCGRLQTRYGAWVHISKPPSTRWSAALRRVMPEQRLLRWANRCRRSCCPTSRDGSCGSRISLMKARSRWRLIADTGVPTVVSTSTLWRVLRRRSLPTGATSQRSCLIDKSSRCGSNPMPRHRFQLCDDRWPRDLGRRRIEAHDAQFGIGSISVTGHRQLDAADSRHLYRRH